MYPKILLSAAIVTVFLACHNNQTTDSSGKAAVSASGMPSPAHYNLLSMEYAELCKQTQLFYCNFTPSSVVETTFLAASTILKDLSDSFSTDVTLKTLKTEAEVHEAIWKIARRMNVDVSKLASLQTEANRLLKDQATLFSQFAYAEAEGEFEFSVKYLTMSFRDEKGVSQVLSIQVGHGE